MRYRAVVILAGLMLLCGCGGPNGTANSDVNGGDFLVATCDSIRGNGATVTASDTTTCVNCLISDKDNVADDDAYSFATIKVDSSSPEGIFVRATAPPGVTFPAGSDAGAFYSPPANTDPMQANAYQGEEVRTYLGGVLQESGVPGVSSNSGGVHTTDPAAPGEFRWIRTTKDFDAVEFRATNAASTGTDNTWKVHELCSHGWIYQPE